MILQSTKIVCNFKCKLFLYSAILHWNFNFVTKFRRFDSVRWNPISISSAFGAPKSADPERDFPLDRVDLAASVQRRQPRQWPLGIPCLCRRTLRSSHLSSIPSFASQFRFAQGVRVRIRGRDEAGTMSWSVPRDRQRSHFTHGLFPQSG